MASNIGLTGVKFAAGVLGNSVAMIADAVHSVSDLLTDFVTLWASKVSHKPRDAEHPYGHGKFESLGALVISGLLVATGVGLGWQAWEHAELIWVGKTLGMPTTIALVGAVVSIAVKEVIYHMTMAVGEKYDSKVIKANAWHHRSDAISSVVALVGVVGGMLQVPIVDPIAGMLVSALIVKAAVELGWDSLKDLTDTNVSPRVIAQVEAILRDMQRGGEGVVGWHQLRGRRMGPYMILDVHVVVDPQLSVTVSHQIAERVRRRIMERMTAVSEVLVHVDPADRAHMQYVGGGADHHHDDLLGHPPLHSPVVAAVVKGGEGGVGEHGHAHEGEVVLEAQRSSGGSHPHMRESTGRLMRPQQEVEADVRRVLQERRFEGQVLALTHFTCHFLHSRLSVQMELVMDESLTIADARAVARALDERVRMAVGDVDAVDVHLELTGSHISRALPIHAAQVGDTQGHIHAQS